MLAELVLSGALEINKVEFNMLEVKKKCLMLGTNRLYSDMKTSTASNMY
jgi:hypothetical protein